MRDRLGKIIYVGKAKNLKKRVISYFQKSKHTFIDRPKLEALVQLVHTIDTVEVKSETEALVLENKFIKQWKPKFNKDLTDDKGFLLVRVDVQNPLPSFRIDYHKRDPKALYYGPFAHGHLLKKTLHEMRLQFGILLGDTFPKKLHDGTYQLYDDARS